MNKIYAIAFSMCLLFLTGCIEDFGGPGEPFNRQAQISGEWVLEEVVQTDMLTLNPQFSTVNITEDFPAFRTVEMQLNESGNYVLTNPDNAPALFPKSGNWKLDDPEFPAQIIIEEEAGTAVLVLRSLNTLTESNTLEVSMVRSLLLPEEKDGATTYKETEAISYDLVFARKSL